MLITLLHVTDTEEAFQLYALENGNVDDIHGLVNYSPLFDQF